MPWKSWAKEALITALICGVVYLAIRQYQRMEQRGGGGNIPVGETAADFELLDVRKIEVRSRKLHALEGPVALGSLKGKPVVLNFWATWCPTCVDELPTINKFYLESEGKYHVLSISSENPMELKEYAQEAGLKVPVLWDRGGSISNAYKVRKIPTIVIIDANGQVVHDFAGAPDIDILRDHMERLDASSDG